MDATQNPLQQTEAVSLVVEQLAVSVTREQRLARPVVRSTTALEKTVVDQLTKAFETFSINLL
jgi:hypothetical protein